MNGLSLDGRRSGFRITDCLDKLRYFCTYDAYRYYDVVGYAHEAEVDTINSELLTATNRAMRARSRWKSWQSFLDRRLDALKAVPQAVDLIDSSDADCTVALEALRRCYAQIASVPWITDMAASKVLYLKRPKLVAISDSYVRKLLSVAEPAWSDYGERGAFYAARGVAVAQAVRSIGLANRQYLERLQDELAALPDAVRLSKARIVDILVWADMAIPRHQGWRKAARECGWQSVGECLS